MQTPAAAFGIFSFKRSGGGKSVPLGSGAELESYYLNFWKGRFLVTLTGFDESPETVAGLLAVAGAVAGKIAEEAAVPSLVAALPEKGLQSGSVKYFRGILGLNNIYPFYTARGLDFAEAVKGDYADGSTLIVLEYGTAAVFNEAIAELGRCLVASERFKKLGGNYLEIDTLRLIDGKGRYLGFYDWGTQLIIAIAPNAATVSDLLWQVIR
jgi:hypothetical protein